MMTGSPDVASEDRRRRLTTVRIVLHAIIAGLALLLAAPPDAHAADPSAEATVQSVDAGSGTIRLDFGGAVGALNLPVQDPAKAQLGTMNAGDVVVATVDSKTNPTVVKALAPAARQVPTIIRLFTLAACSFLLWLIAAAVTDGRPTDFLIGMDNRYSNSKTQLTLWFFTMMTAYLATLALRLSYGGFGFLGGVMIPQNLLILSGLSAATFGGAKAITVQKVDAATASAAQRGLPQTAVAKAVPATTRPNLLADLVQNDNNAADLGDFQMIVVTLVAVVVFGLTVFNYLGAIQLSVHVTLPDVDTTLLSGFGLSQGAYLLKKMASKPGDG